AGLGSLGACVRRRAALARIAADLWLGGPTGVRASYRVALRRFWPQLGMVLLYALAEIGLVVVSLPLLVLAVTIGWLAVLGGLVVWFANPRLRRPWLKWLIVVCAPFGLPWYFGALWMLATQSVILEGLGPSAALARSKALVQGEWWRAFGTVFLIGIIVSVLQYLPSVIFRTIAALLPPHPG